MISSPFEYSTPVKSGVSSNKNSIAEEPQSVIHRRIQSDQTQKVIPPATTSNATGSLTWTRVLGINQSESNSVKLDFELRERLNRRKNTPVLSYYFLKKKKLSTHFYKKTE